MRRDCGECPVFEVKPRAREDLAIALGRGVADGVRQINRGRAGFDGRLGDFFQKIQFSAAGIFGGKFDIAGVGQSLFN